MLSLNLESQILELAQRRGLLDAVATEEWDPRAGSSPQSLDFSTLWGPRIDGLIEAGKLSRASIEALAFELTDPMVEDTVGSWLGSTFEPRPQPEFRFPSLGHRYRDLQLLGAGATAQVFKAFDTQLQRWVALKFLKPGFIRPLESVLREARAQAQIEHPNVCRIYEVGETEGQSFIVMQLADGPTLTSVFKHLEVAEVVGLVHELAEGVHAAHQQGLIHLDIKLGNILLRTLPNGAFQPLITDFGMVRSELDTTTKLCPLGTPPYSSPEQIKGDFSRVDRRSDVYSLGAVLYVLLTGSFPFEADRFPNLLEAIQEQDPIPLRNRKPELSEDLEAILAKCLQKDPHRRYQNAQALATDLQCYLDGQPVSARSHSLWSHTHRWVYRHRKWVMVSIIGFLTMLSLTIWFWLQSRHHVDWMRYISSGHTTKFTMHVPFKAKGVNYPLGDIKPGEIYTLVYHRKEFTVTGYHVGQGGVKTMTYSNADIYRRYVSIWGRNYLFTENGSLIDPAYGKVGTLETVPTKIDALLSGKQFKITFDVGVPDKTGNAPNGPMGDLMIGQSYTGYYKSIDNTYTVTGFHKGKNKINTLSYSNADPKAYAISLWGRKFHFEENGNLVDSVLGLVGHIYFPSEEDSTGLT